MPKYFSSNLERILWEARNGMIPTAGNRGIVDPDKAAALQKQPRKRSLDESEKGTDKAFGGKRNKTAASTTQEFSGPTVNDLLKQDAAANSKQDMQSTAVAAPSNASASTMKVKAATMEAAQKAGKKRARDDEDNIGDNAAKKHKTAGATREAQAAPEFAPSQHAGAITASEETSTVPNTPQTSFGSSPAGNRTPSPPPPERAETPGFDETAPGDDSSLSLTAETPPTSTDGDSPSSTTREQEVESTISSGGSNKRNHSTDDAEEAPRDGPATPRPKLGLSEYKQSKPKKVNGGVEFRPEA